MIKAVIFDVDGVLLDSFEANLKLFQNLMQRSGHTPPTRESFPKFFHLSLTEAIQKMINSNSEKEIERIANMRRSGDVQYPIELLSLPDGVKETIIELHKEYPLGIVTSRIKNGIFESPKLADLQKYFTAVVAYEDTENHKPNPEPLLLCIKKLGMLASEVVYVGDAENDMKAANAAGMKFIYYSKTNLIGADVCTFLFKDLPRIVKSL